MVTMSEVPSTRPTVENREVEVLDEADQAEVVVVAVDDRRCAVEEWCPTVVRFRDRHDL